MRSSSALLLLLVVLAVALVSARSHREIRHRRRPAETVPVTAPEAPLKAPGLNFRPIIGIFTLANSDNPTETGSTISAGYVKWLEQANARVAVIPFNAPQPMLDQLFAGINGLLFTGGGLSLNASTVYFQNALYMWNKAMKANDAGDFFPVWGTCQGFQLMHLLAALPADHEDVLVCNKYDSNNLPLPLDFTSDAPTSQMFSGAQVIPALQDGSTHPTIYEAFATQNITMNLHNCGVSPEDFARNPVLPKFYSILSTNKDLKGLEFVSTVEGIKYPFWAAQWHAERTQYEWDLVELLAHNAEGAATSAYIAQRFMMLARQSQHAFPDQPTEAAALIYNYLPTTTGKPNSISTQQTYQLTFNF